jgi:hypothetical protein
MYLYCSTTGNLARPKCHRITRAATRLMIMMAVLCAARFKRMHMAQAQRKSGFKLFHSSR